MNGPLGREGGPAAPRTGPTGVVATESVVAWERPEVRSAGSEPAGGNPSYDLVNETTGEASYALRDPGLMLRGRAGVPTLVAGPVVGAARGLPLVEVVRVA